MGRTSNFSLLWEFLRFARRYLLPKQVHVLICHSNVDCTDWVWLH